VFLVIIFDIVKSIKVVVQHALAGLDYKLYFYLANCSSLPLQPTPSPSNTQQSSSPAPKPTVDNPRACPNACTCYDDKGKLYHGSEDNVPKTGYCFFLTR